MSITQIKEDMKQAMRNKEIERLSTLRLLISEFETEMKKTGASELSEDQVITVVNRQIKKLDKEIEAYVAVGRTTGKQETEKKILFSYLPEQLGEDEINEMIAHAVSLVDRGEIDNPIKYLASRLKGKADMKKVSELVKNFKR